MPATPIQAVYTCFMVAFILLRHYLELITLGLWFPVFLYEAYNDWVETSQRRKRIRATRNAYIPKPLPSKRLRALTNGDKKTLLHAQTGSPIFAKLPAELRLKVYEHVLAAEGMIHMGIWNKKYWHRICKYEPVSRVFGTGYLHACWAEPRIPGDEHLHRSGDPLLLHTDDMTSDSLLALPLSCKRIYAETIDMLYSENKFNAHRAATIAHMPRSFLPQRLNQIRTLELDIPITRFPIGSLSRIAVHIDDSEKWPAACEVIGNMKGLRSLRVSLSVLGLFSWSSPIAHHYIEPLMALRVEHYDVCLSTLLGDVDLAELGEVPFRVIYRETEGRGSNLGVSLFSVIHGQDNLP